MHSHRYPSLPVLHMRNGSYVPMELVDVEPARVKKITDEQRALLCRYASMKPQDYCRSISTIRNNPNQQRFEDDPFIRAWNLNVDVEMITVPARVLPMPEIVYTNQYQVKESAVRELGTWELPKSTRFYKPSHFPTLWTMINLTSLSEGACVEFFHELSCLAQQRGMDCREPTAYEELNAELYSIDQIIEGLKYIIQRNNDCQLLLVILPGNSQTRSHIYGYLKKLVKLLVDFSELSDIRCFFSVRVRLQRTGNNYSNDSSKK